MVSISSGRFTSSGRSCVSRTVSPADVAVQTTAAILTAAQSPAGGAIPAADRPPVTAGHSSMAVQQPLDIHQPPSSRRWRFISGGHTFSVRSSLSNTHRTTSQNTGAWPLLPLSAASPLPVAPPRQSAAGRPAALRCAAPPLSSQRTPYLQASGRCTCISRSACSGCEISSGGAARSAAEILTALSADFELMEKIWQIRPAS